MHDKFIDALRTGKLKGQTRIILEDVVTKRREIREDTNMITDALTKIFETNVFGVTDMNNLMPLRSIMGGVFLFWNPLAESADNIFPPSQASNKLTGHAGQTTHSSASTTRGNPNGAASYIDAANGQVKFVWDFSLEQGNGQISAACLTNPGAGDAGLYPDGSLPLMKTYGPSNEVSVIDGGIDGYNYGELYAKRAPVKINDNGTGVCLYLEGTTFKELIVRHPFVRPCLIEGPSYSDRDQFTIVSTRSATLSRSFTAEYFQIGQDDSNYYVMERDASTNTRLYVEIVSKSDFSVTSQTIDIAGATLARWQTHKNGVNNGIVSGGFIYWISEADPKTFVRINIVTPADTEVLSSSLTSNINMSEGPVTRTDGLILGKNWLINGDYVYPVAPRSNRSNDNYDPFSSIALYKNGPMTVQSALLWDNAFYNRTSSGAVLYLPHLISINNLSSPVTKTSNRSMRVEYLLTLTGGN